MKVIKTCYEYQKKLRKLRNQFRRGGNHFSDGESKGTETIKDWMLDICWYLCIHMDYDSLSELMFNVQSLKDEMEKDNTTEPFNDCGLA